MDRSVLGGFLQFFFFVFQGERSVLGKLGCYFSEGGFCLVFGSSATITFLIVIVGGIFVFVVVVIIVSVIGVVAVVCDIVIVVIIAVVVIFLTASCRVRSLIRKGGVLPTAKSGGGRSQFPCYHLTNTVGGRISRRHALTIFENN